MSAPMTYGQLFIGPATYIAMFGWLYALIGVAAGLAAWRMSGRMRPAWMLLAIGATAPLVAYAIALATIGVWGDAAASMTLWNAGVLGLIALLPIALLLSIGRALTAKKVVRRA